MREAAFLLTTFLLCAGTSQAQNLNIPKCDVIKAWTQDVVYLAKGTHRYDQLEKARRTVETILTDERTAAVFGKPRPAWNDAERRDVRNLQEQCRRAANDRNSSYRIAYVVRTMDAGGDRRNQDQQSRLPENR